jgi:hypothetical protein
MRDWFQVTLDGVDKIPKSNYKTLSPIEKIKTILLFQGLYIYIGVYNLYPVLKWKKLFFSLKASCLFMKNQQKKKVFILNYLPLLSSFCGYFSFHVFI